MGQRLGEVKNDDLLNDFFCGYDGVGVASFTAATTITITAQHAPSSATYTLANGEVTVTKDGTYEISWGVSLIHPSGTSRTQAQSWLEVNGTEVPGSRGLHYLRQVNHGATVEPQIFLSLSENDVVRIRAARTAGGGSASGLINGSRIALRRL